MAGKRAASSRTAFVRRISMFDNAYWMDLIAGHLFSLDVDRIPNLKAAKELLDFDGCKLYINGDKASVSDLEAISVPVKMAPGWENYDL